MKTCDFIRFSITIFDYSEIEKFTESIREIFKKDFETGIASLEKNWPKIDMYFHPAIGGSIVKQCTFWKTALYPTKIFFTSLVGDGWFTLCNVLHLHLHCDYIQCIFSKEKDSPEFLFHYGGTDGRERDILTYKDPRWVFYEEGEPLDFEDLDLYKNRLIRDRLNDKILIKYIERMGVDFEKIDEEVTDSYTFVLGFSPD
ncbi:MAG: hypothetical protein ILA39_04400 [Bacteroidaceae bacterium]|nr:hypothetical protein [Bacteroidaceae bacterium]MBP1531351.1 hypothetical protein [Bacteroidaceae bacterium]